MTQHHSEYLTITAHNQNSIEPPTMMRSSRFRNPQCYSEEPTNLLWQGNRFRLSQLLLLLSLLLLTSACGDSPAALDPQGQGAATISLLSWILIGLGTLIYLGVCGFLIVALRRKSATDDADDADYDPRQSSPDAGRGIVIWGGIVMPAVVLLVVFGMAVTTLMVLSNAQNSEDLVIDVIGHQWWWEVVYPEADVITANEIYVPVGKNVRINLTASGVIHSFWVPQLHGKLDMVPGHTNSFTIQADEPGEYRGICAEFCGIQHARMLFLVIAVSPEEFDAWIAKEAQPAAEPTAESALAGKEIFMSAACAQCHAIAGTEANGQLGPDLTHFASRREIGAGTLENNRGNLAGWIIGPQDLKPGNLMPSTPLSSQELQDLLNYLDTLE